MDLDAIGLLLYLLYLPLLLVLIIIAAINHKEFLTKNHLLSTLAETTSPSFEIVSALIALFSFLRLFFLSSLAEILPENIFSYLTLFFLFLSCIGSLLVAFYPRDKFRKVHGVFGTFLAVGILGSQLFLIYPIWISTILPLYLIVFNIIIVLLTIMVLMSDFVAANKLDGYLFRQRFFWQRAMMILVLAWDFYVGLLVFHSL